jgi:hypothetical protein
MPAKKTIQPLVYQLKINLRGTRPPIWRRVQVPADVTLARLHETIQDVMPWEDYHLHLFTIAGNEYGPRDPEWESDYEDERKVKLNKVVTSAPSKFEYVYDFGDNWEHEIVVEKVLPAEPGVPYPLCLDGARNGPPEDCGGVWGYQDLLKALRNPRTREDQEMLEWLGEFDPEEFSVDLVNEGFASRKVLVAAGKEAGPAEAAPARKQPATPAPYTARQGQFLAFIYYYTKVNGVPPAESDIARYFRISGPAAHQMVVTLEQRGFLRREPGVGRSIRLLLSHEQLPDLE